MSEEQTLDCAKPNIIHPHLGVAVNLLRCAVGLGVPGGGTPASPLPPIKWLFFSSTGEEEPGFLFHVCSLERNSLFSQYSRSKTLMTLMSSLVL